MKKSLLTLGGLWLVGSDAVSFFLVFDTILQRQSKVLEYSFSLITFCFKGILKKVTGFFKERIKRQEEKLKSLNPFLLLSIYLFRIDDFVVGEKLVLARVRGLVLHMFLV